MDELRIVKAKLKQRDEDFERLSHENRQLQDEINYLRKKLKETTIDEIKIVIPQGTTNREYYTYLLYIQEQFDERMNPHICHSYENESKCQAWWDSEYEQ